MVMAVMTCSLKPLFSGS